MKSLLRFARCRLGVLLLALLGVPEVAHAQDATGLDTTFNASVGENFELNDLLIQPDGKILLVGSFSKVNGVARDGIARLKSDGTLDPDFTATANGYVIFCAALQIDGKIVLGGNFFEIDGADHHNVARLKPDGSLDPDFTGKEDDYSPFRLAIDVDGNILLGRANLSSDPEGKGNQNDRLKPDGSLDPSFNLTIDPNGGIQDVLALADGGILVAGYYRQINGTDHSGGLTRINGSGGVNNTFLTTVNPTNTGTVSVNTVAQQADGKFVFAGVYDPQSPSDIARVNPDGSLDPTFKVTVDRGVNKVAVQPDGKILIAGDFRSVNGVPRKFVARLNSDGTLDPDFNVNSDGHYVDNIAVQADGKVILGGDFKTVNGAAHNGLVRLYPNASVHSPFFSGETSLGNGVEYLAFANGNPFGYYSYLSDPAYIFHFDLGFEYIFDANDGKSGVFLYDFASNGFFYTSPSFPFPYLYDFSLNSTVYYYPDPNNAGHYNTNGLRYFYNFATGQIISK